MAITISGENNNDKILAQDGVIDQISGLNMVGVITATTFTGNLTGNVTGNLTGNVNSTSPLLLQTGGSERFRITGNNELGIAGANYGSSGQVLTSGGSGSAVSWTTPVTINNNADNRVITGTGSANVLNAESNVHVDGSGRLLVGTSTNNAHANADNAVISGTGNIGLSIMSTDSGRSSIYFGDSSSSPGSYAGFIDFIHSSDSFNIGRGNDNSLIIDSGGRVQIGGVTGPNNAKLFVAGTNSTNYVTIRNTSAADSSGSRWSSVRFQGTQSGGEVSDLVHLQANHEGSSDDQKGAFQIQINDGNDGDSLQERMHLYSTNSTSQPIVKFISSNSGEMLNLQNSSGGGQGMVFGVDTSGSNDTTYLRNNTSAHFDFTFYMGSVSSTYERIRIKQDEFRNSTQFYSNKTAIASNKTITTDYNNMTIGNITINSGVTVTVNSGARWVIV